MTQSSKDKRESTLTSLSNTSSPRSYVASRTVPVKAVTVTHPTQTWMSKPGTPMNIEEIAVTRLPHARVSIKMVTPHRVAPHSSLALSDP